MLKLDVCIETIFTNFSVEERIRRVARAGYDCVEMWFHDSPEKDLHAIAKVLKETKVTLNNLVVNAPAGTIGGSPVKKEDQKKYLERLKALIPIAKSLGSDQAITCAGNEVAGLSRSEMKKQLIKTLIAAAEVAGKKNFTLLLEPLNTDVDHPGYFLNSSREGAEIVREINSPNLKLLYDIYHMQIMEGNIVSFLAKNIDIIGHFHAAGVPGRHELFDGEINYPFIVNRLNSLGYKGYFGLEYLPAMEDQETSLKSVKEYLTNERA